MTKMTFLALIAIFLGTGILGTTGITVTNGFTVTNPAMAQTVIDNATMASRRYLTWGGNMTDGNMTEATGQISGGGEGAVTRATQTVNNHSRWQKALD